MTRSDRSREAAISVVMPVYRPETRFLRRAVMSVLQQTREDWQLVLVDDGSKDGGIDEVLEWAALDPRVTVVKLPENLGISAASNMGLEHVTAPWVALLDHDDLLEPEALAEVLEAAEICPDAEIIYTDRDAIDKQDIPTESFAKPDWSPRRLRGNMYIAHLTVLLTQAIREVGGFRPAFDGSQDHDLVLRVSERGRNVVHIPRVLYHWRQLPQSTAKDPAAKPYAAERGRAAVQEHLSRVKTPGSVRHSPYPGFYLIDYTPRPTKASLIIPTRGSSGRVHGERRVFAVETVRSILAHNYTTEYEIVIVHDTDADPSYISSLSKLAGERLRVVNYDPPFNFSAKINLGVEASDGEMVVLLNDDVEVITPRWLDQLVALGQEPDVGAVGAKLYFEDGSIQHAGHFFGNGQVRHVSFRKMRSTGDFGSDVIDREVVGVTAAVLAQRREIWSHVGGFDEALPNNFNDVDYCNRIRSHGYRIVQANSVELYHFESKTREPRVAQWEAERIVARLGSQIDHDPYTPLPAGEVSGIKRDVRDWARVSRTVLREEGTRAFIEKARRRLARRLD